jgi:cytochrome b
MQTVKVWDLPVRIFHWSLVITFAIAYLSGEDGENLHEIAGYLVLGLVLFRIVWGFIGTRHSRFSDFIYGPAAIVDYLRGMLAGNPKHYLGHNPAGGLMVIALLLSLLAVSWTGLEVLAQDGEGPLAGNGLAVVASAQADDDEHEGRSDNGARGDGEEFWEELHELTANFTLLLVFVHIAAVIFSSVVHRENLVRAMVTGRKEIDSNE